MLIVVEVAIDAGCCAMKQVRHGPEQVFEIRFETRVFERGGECVEDMESSISETEEPSEDPGKSSKKRKKESAKKKGGEERGEAKI